MEQVALLFTLLRLLAIIQFNYNILSQ